MLPGRSVVDQAGCASCESRGTRAAARRALPRRVESSSKPAETGPNGAAIGPAAVQLVRARCAQPAGVGRGKTMAIPFVLTAGLNPYSPPRGMRSSPVPAPVRVAASRRRRNARSPLTLQKRRSFIPHFLQFVCVTGNCWSGTCSPRRRRVVRLRLGQNRRIRFLKLGQWFR